MVNKWSPSYKGPTLVLSEENYKVTATTTDWESVLAIESNLSDKVYFEVYFGVVDSYSSVGVCSSSLSLEGHIGQSISGWSTMATGRFYNNNTYVAGPDWNSNGNVVGVAVDLASGKIWFSVNGVFSGDPSAGTGAAFSGLTGTLYPAISLYTTSSWCVGRFSNYFFSYVPPAGFDAWSDDYIFSGSVFYGNIPVSGSAVCLYRRDSFDLVDFFYTTNSGTFQVVTPIFEDHYMVALYTISGTENALVFDWLHPRDL